MKPLIQTENVKFSQKLTLLVCAFLLCLIMTTMLNVLILAVTGADSMSFINLSILTQNLFAFILPVIITLVFITQRPLSFIQADRFPSIKALIMTLSAYIVMTPAMNCLVEWNASMSLPESLSGIETWMRNAEAVATATTDKIIQQNNIFLSISIVGILTGISEETLFRGGLQRILMSRPMNVHYAIWITAFIFSAVHFQFFGFFPRLLLGAFFGYMAYWSGSLWTAVIAHAVNNSMVIIANAISKSHGFNLDNLGVPSDGSFPILATLSILLTALLLYYYPKNQK